MDDIIATIGESAGRVHAAQRAHRAVMAEAERFLKPLWEEYIRLFGDLAERAEEAGIEWGEHAPPSSDGLRARWGNAGLRGIAPDPSFPADSGIMRITTMDSFRGEVSEEEASMPRRFMGPDGLSLMRSEAARLEGELEAAIALKQEEDERAQDARDREDFERLSARFGGHVG